MKELRVTKSFACLLEEIGITTTPLVCLPPCLWFVSARIRVKCAASLLHLRLLLLVLLPLHLLAQLLLRLLIHLRLLRLLQLAHLLHLHLLLLRS